MKNNNLISQRASRVWLDGDSCDLEDFKREIAREATAAD